MNILVIGGAGFIGSHVAEYYQKQGHMVSIFDNSSRHDTLGKSMANTHHNIEHLTKQGVSYIKGDIRDVQALKDAVRDKDAVFHTAAQVAVTTSLTDPRTDFEINALGTFNVLEALRQTNTNPKIVYCSTNKVYGNNVNTVSLAETEHSYIFKDLEHGIPEHFSIDSCEHTPYGNSKLVGDLYMQDYAHVYGLQTAIFRMSCIYGTRQFGVEDQGWVSWFTIATLLGKPLTIYGDGKQVRDVLYISDLLDCYNRFVEGPEKHGIFNVGGGSQHTLSLLQLLDMLEELTGKKSPLTFSDWRPSDQKVYISDIRKAHDVLGWKPQINPKVGVSSLVEWIQENRHLF